MAPDKTAPRARASGPQISLISADEAEALGLVISKPERTPPLDGVWEFFPIISTKTVAAQLAITYGAEDESRLRLTSAGGKDGCDEHDGIVKLGYEVQKPATSVTTLNINCLDRNKYATKPQQGRNIVNEALPVIRKAFGIALLNAN
ncbi:MAG TPA: hypothetical protein VGV18_00910 [Verrucomicrobiae bacterium]|nr:hypothetical protein [Verrucomicrobiae bacterium]